MTVATGSAEFRPARRVRASAPRTRGRPTPLAAVRGRRWAIHPRQSKKRRFPDGTVGMLSLEVQEAACRAAIAQVDPDPRSIVVIPDHGRPGGPHLSRPGRAELLELLRAGVVDAVMAFKADRLGRDIE